MLLIRMMPFRSAPCVKPYLYAIPMPERNAAAASTRMSPAFRSFFASPPAGRKASTASAASSTPHHWRSVSVSSSRSAAESTAQLVVISGR